MPNKPSSVTAHLQERMRLDKWLWAARFFKTRHLAVEAINGGKVHVNGQRAKPGKEIECGQKMANAVQPVKPQPSILKAKRALTDVRPCSIRSAKTRKWALSRKGGPANEIDD